jgi:AraC family transcriptional activator of pobA
MNQVESISEFYRNNTQYQTIELPLNNTKTGHFNVFSRGYCRRTLPYHRRDFYKVALIIGSGILQFDDKKIIIDKPALLISSPSTPYAWEATSEEQSGWFCLFSEEFIRSPFRDKSIFKQNYTPLGIELSPISFLTKTAFDEISSLFQKMIQIMASDYIHKYDLLKNYLQLILHEALKIQPENNAKKQRNSTATHRITYDFFELLESQFPIDSPDIALRLKTAKDYAEKMSIHINHLNHCVKEITGKTLSQHINNRVIQEAKALLQHSNWNISQIAYSLGFEYASYFTTFFKKQTGMTPGTLRKENL